MCNSGNLRFLFNAKKCGTFKVAEFIWSNKSCHPPPPPLMKILMYPVLSKTSLSNDMLGILELQHWLPRKAAKGIVTVHLGQSPIPVTITIYWVGGLAETIPWCFRDFAWMPMEVDFRRFRVEMQVPSINFWGSSCLSSVEVGFFCSPRNSLTIFCGCCEFSPINQCSFVVWRHLPINSYLSMPTRNMLLPTMGRVDMVSPKLNVTVWWHVTFYGGPQYWWYLTV